MQPKVINFSIPSFSMHTFISVFNFSGDPKWSVRLVNGFTTYCCLMTSVRLSSYKTELVRSGDAISMSVPGHSLVPVLLAARRPNLSSWCVPLLHSDSGE